MAKSGPKTEPGLEDMKLRSYTVDQMTHRRLGAVGGGNYSRGLRKAARVAYELMQREPDGSKK